MKNKSEELQRFIAMAVVKNLQNRQYSQLAMFMDILARANDNQDILERIKRVKEGCFPFPFETLVGLYMMSFGKSPNRSVRFLQTGQKFSWRQVQAMAEEQITTPLGVIAFDLLGSLAESQSASLQQVVGAMQSLPAEKQPEVEDGMVIFDNEIEEFEPEKKKEEGEASV